MSRALLSVPGPYMRVPVGRGYAPALFCSIHAQVSFSVTVRLKTSAPGFESRSTQKYPRRSNWNRAPGGASATLGSSLHAVNAQRRRIQDRAVVIGGAWGFRREQPVVEPDLGVKRVPSRHPVQRRLDLPAVGRVAASRRRVDASIAAPSQLRTTDP